MTEIDVNDDPFINPDGSRYVGPLDRYGRPLRSASVQERKQWEREQWEKEHMTQEQRGRKACGLPEKKTKAAPVTMIGKAREAAGLPWRDADDAQEAVELGDQAQEKAEAGEDIELKTKAREAAGLPVGGHLKPETIEEKAREAAGLPWHGEVANDGCQH